MCNSVIISRLKEALDKHEVYIGGRTADFFIETKRIQEIINEFEVKE